MDLVYVLRQCRDNPELRYSLRSMEANLPHDRVWIVGTMVPPFLVGVESVHVRERDGQKWRNLVEALWAASQSPDISEDFVYCNDDFFVMEPIPEMPILTRGPLQGVKSYQTRNGTYGRGYVETEKLLRRLGVEGDLLSYELHVPIPINKAHLAEVLAQARPIFKGGCLQTRTLYGNYWKIGGEQMSDVKVRRSHVTVDWQPFLSTNEQSFKDQPIGQRIRKAFPNPSKYERTKQ